MATIRQIAERAGVSIGTVDRVIHERGKVSAQAESRVRQAIRELGYRPNLFARHLKRKQGFRIAVLMPAAHQDGGYWELPAQGIRRAAEELAGQRVEVALYSHDRYSEDSLGGRFEEILAAEPNGLLIAPVFSVAWSELVERIPPGVPYVFLDTDVPDTIPLSFIGQDPHASGRLGAQLVGMLAGGAGTFAVIRILPGDYHIEGRVRGFRSFFALHNGVTVTIHDLDGSAPQAEFDRFVATLRESSSYPDGFFVTNASTFRVARAVRGLGERQRPAIIGYDLIEENIALLKEGAIDFLISQVPERQGYDGVYALHRHLVLREPVEPRISMPIDIVTRENVDFYAS